MIDKDEFQKAFSALHASEDTVTEVLKMTTQNNQPKHKRWTHIAIAAAVTICLLVTTALAAPILYDRITGSVKDSWEAATPTVDHGNSVTGTAHQIQLEIPMNENAPEEIETYYMPQLPAEYTQNFGYAYGGYNYDQLDVIVYFWGVSEEEKASIHFFQHSAHSYEVDGMGFSLFLTDGQEPMLEQTELGGVEGFLIVGSDDGEGGEQYFCWTDGDYVFYMRFPGRFTQEQMAEIIATVRPVADIRPYLISMTDEELERTFADRP